MSTNKQKIVLKKLKQLNTIWHPESTLVFKSSEDKVVIGRYVDDNFISLDEEALDACLKWNFKYDKDLVDEEVDGSEEEKEDMIGEKIEENVEQTEEKVEEIEEKVDQTDEKVEEVKENVEEIEGQQMDVKIENKLSDDDVGIIMGISKEYSEKLELAMIDVSTKKELRYGKLLDEYNELYKKYTEQELKLNEIKKFFN